MFTNSIDGTDFFRKILAFSIKLFGSFSNSLSSKEKEIFDIDSSSEITVLEKCFFQICHNFTGINLFQRLIFNNNSDNKIISFLLRNFRSLRKMVMVVLVLKIRSKKLTKKGEGYGHRLKGKIVFSVKQFILYYIFIYSIISILCFIQKSPFLKMIIILSSLRLS